MKKPNRYSEIIQKVFFDHYSPGATSVAFAREELVDVAKRLGIERPLNLGDIIYSMRYRTALPDAVRSKAPPGREWVIRSVGRSKYCFVATTQPRILPNANLSLTKVPDATPGIVAMYALSDEQALLAKLRYNRLVDVFTAVTCYSLQSHLRTAVRGMGQIETDELYVGLDKRGAHYLFPVQAKGGKDVISIVQVEQDIRACRAKFPKLMCRPIGAQFMADEVIALFEFEPSTDGMRISAEKHYHLVPPSQLSADEIVAYQNRLPGGAGPA